MLVISSRTRRPQHVQFRLVEVGLVGPQLMRNVLLLAQMVRPCGFGGMRREYRLNAHVTDELNACSSDTPLRCSRPMQSAIPPGLRCAGIAQVFAAPAYAVRFFCRVHRHEPI